MTTYNASHVAWMLIDGYNLQPYLDAYDRTDNNAEVADATPMGVNWPVKKQIGRNHMGISATLFYDDAALASNAYVMDPLTGFTDYDAFCFAYTGAAAGAPFLGIPSVWVTGFDRVQAATDIHKINLTYLPGQNSWGSDDGLILQPLGTVSAAGNSSSIDGGVAMAPTSITSSSVANPTVLTTAAHGLTGLVTVVVAGHTGSTPSLNGTWLATVIDATHISLPVACTVGGTGGTVQYAGGACFYVQAPLCVLGGYTNWIVSLQDSADNSTFAAVSGSPQATITTGLNGYAIAIPAGTVVRRYTRALWALTGSGSSPSLNFFAGVARR